MSKPTSIDDILACPQLPSPPSVALRLLELCNNPDTGVRPIVDTIQTDPALAAKILRSANSSYSGARKEIRSLQHAVSMIGTRVIASIALTFSLDSQSLKKGRQADQYNAYWRRSIVQAAAAESLPRKLTQASPGEMFTAGLLIDIGRLALLKVSPSGFERILDDCDPQESPGVAAEQQHLGFDHAELGARLLTTWKLPTWLCDVTRYHESDPQKLPEDVASSRAVQCLIMAAAVGDFFCGKPTQQSALRVQTLAGSLFGFDDKALFEYLDSAETNANRAAESLETNLDELPSAAELMANAQEQQIQMAMRQDAERRSAEESELEAQVERTMLQSQLA